MASPYTNLESRSFWRSGVGETTPATVKDFYRAKFPLGRSQKIATAGSCFAQHVSNYLRKNGFSVLDAEPPPSLLDEEDAKRFGYGIYSARYGNIYTVRQLLQLARDARSGSVDPADIWTKDGRYFDVLRPNFEPDGFQSAEEALELRRDHLAKVQGLFEQMDVFIFTLGLTEAWIDRRCGRVFPTAPGTIAGSFDPDIHVFKNFAFEEIYADFEAFRACIRERNPGLRIILTVSPVPLTATASGAHVLLATTYSKSVLRAVAGALAASHDDVDYFPSYEVIASPWSRGAYYEDNLRSVRPDGVAAVMRIFFEAHLSEESAATGENSREARRNRRLERRELRRAKKKRRNGHAEPVEDEVVCEDLLLETFAP